jgi:hypothetical protein
MTTGWRRREPGFDYMQVETPVVRLRRRMNSSAKASSPLDCRLNRDQWSCPFNVALKCARVTS